MEIFYHACLKHLSYFLQSANTIGNRSRDFFHADIFGKTVSPTTKPHNKLFQRITMMRLWNVHVVTKLDEFSEERPSFRDIFTASLYD